MKINKTHDYKKFEMDVANRDVRKITKLVRTMKKYGWIESFPMTVAPTRGGKFVIKDGQNRFEAAKHLDIPVLYVCAEGAKDFCIAEINSAATPWSMRDYLSSFCKQGRRDYLEVAEYCERTGIKLGQAVSMFAGEVATSGNQGGAFKDGRFKVKNYIVPATVGDIVATLKKHITWATDSLLVSAISRACCVKEFKPEMFKHKCETNPGLLRKQPNLDSYAQLVEEIYNHHSHCPLPLKFMCEQEMRKREFGRNNPLNAKANGNGK